MSSADDVLIQQNVNGSYFFNRSWDEFKVGFGDTSGNYWLGNHLLNLLTQTDRYKLRVDVQQLSTGDWYYACLLYTSDAADE